MDHALGGGAGGDPDLLELVQLKNALQNGNQDAEQRGSDGKGVCRVVGFLGNVQRRQKWNHRGGDDLGRLDAFVILLILRTLVLVILDLPFKTVANGTGDIGSYDGSGGRSAHGCSL